MSNPQVQYQKGYSPQISRRSLNQTQIKMQQQQQIKQALPPVKQNTNYNEEQVIDAQNQQRNMLEEQQRLQTSYQKRSLLKSPQQARQIALEKQLNKVYKGSNQFEVIQQQNAQTGFMANTFSKGNKRNDKKLQKLDKSEVKSFDKQFIEDETPQHQSERNNQTIQNELTNLKGLELRLAKKQSEIVNLDEKINDLLKQEKYIQNFMKLLNKIEEKSCKFEKKKDILSFSFEFGQLSFENIDIKQQSLEINKNNSIKINNIYQQKEEIKRLSVQIETLQQENHTKALQIEEKEKKILILDQEKQSYAEINKKLQNDFEQKISQNINLEETIQNQNAELKSLYQQIEMKNQSINNLKEDIERLNSELEKCNLEIAQRLKEETEWKNQNNQIVNSEIEKLNLKLISSEQENERLTKELESLKQNIITQQNNEEVHQNENLKKDQIIQDLYFEKEKIQNNFQEDIQKKDQMIQDLNNNIEEIQEQLQDSKQQIDELQNEIELQQYREKPITLMVTATNLQRNEEIKVRLMDSINDLYVMANLRGIFNELPIKSDISVKVQSKGQTKQKQIQKHEWQKKFYELFVPDQYNKLMQMEFSSLE